MSEQESSTPIESVNTIESVESVEPIVTPPRRRRKRRPKWVKSKFTYFLWRNWPLIRFSLICILLVAMLFGMVRCAVGAISGLFRDDGPVESKPGISEPVDTTPPETTEPEVAADELMRQADFLAAGYDYEAAAQLLRTSSYYDSSAEYQDRVAQYEADAQKLVPYGDMQNITHIFFHSLIVDNARCFDGDYTEAGYNQYMTTIPEFIKILESMYERGFVLVSPYDVAYEYVDENGQTKMKYGEIMLPEGKTPFVMSQDDVNYYGYMIGDGDPKYERPATPQPTGDGFAHKIVIGEDGYPACEYMDANGQIHVGSYDLVPLLEDFIQEHPDFSYRGARAILGMTGYEGVFGYRTKPAYEEKMGSEAYKKECEEAMAVAQCLRDHGWILASHSYGHPAYGNVSAEKVESDSDKWEKTVQPIIGDCDVILYPHGSDIAGIGKYTFDNAKFKALYEDGYRYFYNVDSHVAWQQLGDDYFRGGRRNLDGYRMWYTPKKVADLFNVSEVFDPDRPTPVPSI